ncbi:MAG: hypothetical protein HKL87_02390, partial [Acidimicrobiaceae bacterium]|nr:hypothetical protein [Acidimicrobiaceae bacterium]
VLLALLAWPHDRRALSSALVAPLWASVWVLNALLQFVSVHSGAMSLSAMAAQAESGAPGLVSRLDQWFARGALPGATSDVLAGVFLLVGLWGLLGGVPRRASAGLGAFLALASWVLFQGAGDLTSGRATDPNSGPLYLLFALALWSVARQSGDATMTIDDRRDGADDLQTEEAVSFLARATPRVRLKDRAASTLS